MKGGVRDRYGGGYDGGRYERETSSKEWSRERDINR